MRDIKSIVFCFLLVILTSCVITEEYTFKNDGKISFKINVDGTQLMKNSNDKLGEKIDTIIAFSDFIKEKKDSIDALSADEKKRIESLKDFKLKIAMNAEKDEYLYELFGDFKDIKALNKVLELEDLNEMSKFRPNVFYSWNGKKLERMAIKGNNIPADSLMMFSKCKVIYNFEKEVKKVSDPRAKISNNNKTVTIEYTPEEYFNSKKTEIKIDL